MTRAPPSVSRWTISAVRVRGQGQRPTSSRLVSSMATMLTFAGGGRDPRMRACQSRTRSSICSTRVDGAKRQRSPSMIARHTKAAGTRRRSAVPRARRGLGGGRTLLLRGGILACGWGQTFVLQRFRGAGLGAEVSGSQSPTLRRGAIIQPWQPWLNGSHARGTGHAGGAAKRHSRGLHGSRKVHRRPHARPAPRPLLRGDRCDDHRPRGPLHSRDLRRPRRTLLPAARGGGPGRADRQARPRGRDGRRLSLRAGSDGPAAAAGNSRVARGRLRCGLRASQPGRRAADARGPLGRGRGSALPGPAGVLPSRPPGTRHHPHDRSTRWSAGSCATCASRERRRPPGGSSGRRRAARPRGACPPASASVGRGMSSSRVPAPRGRQYERDGLRGARPAAPGRAASRRWRDRHHALCPRRPARRSSMCSISAPELVRSIGPTSTPALTCGDELLRRQPLQAGHLRARDRVERSTSRGAAGARGARDDGPARARRSARSDRPASWRRSGTVTAEAGRAAFREQIEALLEGGVDCSSWRRRGLGEIRHAVAAPRAYRAICRRGLDDVRRGWRHAPAATRRRRWPATPRVGVAASSGRTVGGLAASLSTWALVLHEAGADARVSCMPNAGCPSRHGERLIYLSSPAYFAGYARRMPMRGCASSAAAAAPPRLHIRAMREAVDRHARTAPSARGARVGGPAGRPGARGDPGARRDR